MEHGKIQGHSLAHLVVIHVAAERSQIRTAIHLIAGRRGGDTSEHGKNRN